MNFTIPEDLIERLRADVTSRKRSALVAEAIGDKLDSLREQQLKQALVEGYSARRKEDAKLNEEWEKATLDGWSD